jgi:hypothetical protein
LIHRLAARESADVEAGDDDPVDGEDVRGQAPALSP